MFARPTLPQAAQLCFYFKHILNSKGIFLMADHILGPCTGAVTAEGATLKAFIAKGKTVHLRLTPVGSTTTTHAPTLRINAGLDWEIASFVLTGLQANLEHRYTLKLDQQPGSEQSGSFCTFPLPDTPASFRILCGGDAGGDVFSKNSNHKVFDLLREQEAFDATGNRQALFFLHLGDMHYGDIEEADINVHLNGYRETLEQSRQAAFFRQIPLAYVWDDHDFCGNASFGTSAGCATAQMSYRVGIPHYPLLTGTGGGPIYQAFTVGRVRFLLTDTRSARSSRTAPDDAAKTILGPTQKDWLKQELRVGKDRYALMIWVNTVPWLGGPNDVSANNLDGWANYRTERAELGAFVQSEGVRNLLMLCADAHMVAFDDGSHNRDVTGAGGFPVFHAAPLDRSNSRKGGDNNYSHGIFDEHRGQYGVIEISDDGRGPLVQYRLSGKHMGATLFSFTS
jgi:phosphodiesterase/alkaline phosphatase D-like protein